MLWFVTFLGGTALFLYGLYSFRRWEQNLMDADHVTYKLVFPKELDLEHATRFFSCLSGLYPSIRHYSMRGRNTLCLEVYADQQGITHLLRFPKSYTDVIIPMLSSVIPSLGITEVLPVKRLWQYAMEIRPQNPSPIQTEPRTGKPEIKDLPPSTIGTLLASMAYLQDKDAILVQIIFTPTGHDGTFRASAKLASAGHDIRAHELVKNVLIGYRHLQVFAFHHVTKLGLEKITNHTSPIQHWPLMVIPSELAILGALPIGSPEVPGMSYGKGRRLVAEASIPTDGFVIGTSSFPGKSRTVAIAPKSLMYHAWCLGPTGSGKSTLLHGLATQMMEQGHGLILIEPKGDLARDVLKSVPKHRIDDVIWFDPSDVERPIGLNVLSGSDPEQAAGHIVSLFKGIYGDSWGSRLEWILKYSILTAALGGLTLVDVMQLLLNKDFRNAEVKKIRNPLIKQFWREFDENPDNAKQSVINKLDAFAGFGNVRNIVGQIDGLDMNDVVNNHRILLVPLTASLGESNVSMMGSLISWRLWQAVRTRQSRQPLALMIDEWQRFTDMSVSMEDALAQARGYNMGLILANQTTGQLSTSLLSAVRGNVGSQIMFRLNSEDAKKLQTDFQPMSPDELQGLDQYEVAARLMTPQGAARVATVRTQAAPMPTGAGVKAQAASRQRYGVDRREVEQALYDRHQATQVEPKKASIGRRNVE